MFTNGQAITYLDHSDALKVGRYAGTLTKSGELLLGTDEGQVIINPDRVITPRGNVAEVISVWDDVEGNAQTLVRKSSGPSDFDEAEVWGMMIVRDFFEGIIPMGTVTTVKFQGNEVTYKVIDRK